jgi:hypothetical protein
MMEKKNSFASSMGRELTQETSAAQLAIRPNLVMEDGAAESVAIFLPSETLTDGPWASANNASHVGTLTGTAPIVWPVKCQLMDAKIKSLLSGLDLFARAFD